MRTYEKDIVTISVVNYACRYGDKEANLKGICGYVEALARRGSDIIVLPEVALCGYDNQRDITDPKQKNQQLLAEQVPGPSSNAVAEITKKYGVYAVFGMTERASDGKVYNAAVACGPEGVIGSYHKIHLPKEEVYWAERGEEPFLFDTPWGPVGVGICYDVYWFPELFRYYRARGARLCLNPTIVAKEEVPGEVCRLALEHTAITSSVYIASAGMTGLGLHSHGLGGSSIIGPSMKLGDAYYYAGRPFHGKDSDQEEVFTATVDLSLADHVSDWVLYYENPETGAMDWRPELYQKWSKEIVDRHEW
ncbi:MAG: carbon-nitrogen hydrolase family protein [Eubacterium sp.]|nr:carbon-nitrogen hydrolase family protein [Eubacterium sp.]